MLRTPCRGALLLPPKSPSCVQRSVTQLGRGQEQALLGSQVPDLGRGGQWVYPMVQCDGVGGGRQGSPETSLRGWGWGVGGPAKLLSQEVRQTLCSVPKGMGRLQPVSIQSLLLAGV